MNYLSHYGVKGMHWGVRRYQDYDGHRIKTPDGMVIKKGSTFTRFTARGKERKNTYGKYASKTHFDHEAYMWDAVNNQLGFKKHKNIYEIKITNVEPAVVRSGNQVISDLVSKIGNKKTTEAYTYLKDVGYYDDNKSHWDKAKLYEASWKKDNKTKEQIETAEKVVKARMQLGKALNKYMYANIDDIRKEYTDAGYDAIIDPEDLTYNYDMPMILLNSDVFKETSRRKLSKKEEARLKDDLD